MSNWCKYCKGNYPKYWCSVTNDYIPWLIVERCCKENGYKCEYYPNYYISTSVGLILNKNNNDKVLGNMKKLRKEYLEKNEKYDTLLKTYDMVGPKLAMAVENDENKEEIATVLYERVFTPVSELLDKNDDKRAVETYYSMVLLLANYYGLTHNNTDSIDNKKIDHVMILKLKESN